MSGIPLAVLIDGENVAASHMSAIMERANDLGEPATRCVIGDFSANRLAEWVRVAPMFALDLVFQPSCGKGRNSADIALTIRAMDLLATNAFRRFLLVSSDSDFAPLAQRLCRSGVAVFGMGAARQDSIWRAACTGFFDLDGVPAPEPASDAVAKVKPVAANTPAAVKPKAVKPQPPTGRTEASRQDLEAVRKILAEATAGDETALSLSRLGQLIRRKSPALGARVCGKGKLIRNLRADSHIEVRIHGPTLEAMLRQRKPTCGDAAASGC